MDKKTFYITTAIHYASGFPHIGHAYEETIADVIAKYKKMIGYDTCLLTGMDEHGQKIAEKAVENNMEPQLWTNFIADQFKILWEKLDINYDYFIRTTEKRHEESVQKIFSELYQKKDIYLGTWDTLYCVGCEEAYTQSEVISKPDGLYCRVGHKLTSKSEPSYFFRMSSYNEWIKEYILSHNEFLLPKNRENEVMNSFINKGVEDLSISRTSFNWGIKVDEDNKHVIYVWLDALMSYITGIGYKQEDDSLFQKYWQNENSEIVHIIGKDITRFHAIYWPIFLKELNVKLPDHIISHGWIMAEDGRKMSKSFKNVIDPIEIINEFGSDAVKYYFIKEFFIDTDNSFSRTKFIELYNNDLVNIYGNLISRYTGMVKKYNNGVIIKSDSDIHYKDVVLKTIEDCLNTIENKINKFNIKLVLESILEIGKCTNKFVEEIKPWTLAKEGKTDELNSFLYTLGYAIKVIVSLLQPILKHGTKRMIKQLNFSEEQVSYANITNMECLNNHKINIDESIMIYSRFGDEELEIGQGT